MKSEASGDAEQVDARRRRVLIRCRRRARATEIRKAERKPSAAARALHRKTLIMVFCFEYLGDGYIRSAAGQPGVATRYRDGKECPFRDNPATMHAELDFSLSGFQSTVQSIARGSRRRVWRWPLLAVRDGLGSPRHTGTSCGDGALTADLS